MTLQSQSNPIARFFQGMLKLATDLMPKERAVRMWDIVSFVQKQLDEQGTVNDFGDMMSSGYVLDAYIDDAGTFAIITRSDGKLYKIPVFVDDQSQITMGEQTEVFMEFTPVSRNLMISRQADGSVRWYAMPACTAFLNRSGEIDSRALFDAFVEYAERSNEYPELDFFHLGEYLTLGKADLLFRDDVNFCASGVFYDTDIARAAVQSLEERGDYWGLSIAYLPTREPEKIRSVEGVEIPVFNDGICRFISLLPEDTAASILTSITTQEEVNRMNEKQKKALKELTGSDTKLFDSIVEQLETNNRSAGEPGVITRQTQAQAVAKAKPAALVAAKTHAPAANTPVASAQPAPVQRELTDDEIAAIFGSDAFKQAVGNIFTELRAAETPDSDEAEDAVEEPTTEETPAGEARSVKDLLVELIEKVDGVSKNRDAELQEILDDLPTKIAKAKIVRPRGSATMLPGALTVQERKSLPLAEIAARTLEKIGAAE
jgi:hypothetical protein